ncbi:hypothetical protein L226DRAFT_459840 [Lentinus tigrinus ALCF2SS1-7]|uniref:BTB domain-containing protein n=1 Tax=Lentinus tigrinus ALCF2SS1-6 TaxID=1328759 RepID=A0A5C2RR86_9APHY|nr:hypothetical protein L227DRAFT_512918 [Lentinus tigrinus ALCF2SS1-6]RPD76780.1 hypothetical protein L226DRAFT_459840 [Lentinus tigrinus ALCF2SS1-7]
MTDITVDFLRKRSLQDETQVPIPAKRARTGELRKDEEFWYEDGTIELLAGDVRFRVYKGVLAKHSPVFADMFSLPQPQSASSCQVLESQAVHLDDSPEDLRIVLKAILPPQDRVVVHKKPCLPSYGELSAYARIGHKYQIDYLVDQTLDYLKHHFTNDFDTWRNRMAFVPRKFETYHAIGVVNIARLVNCDSILPTALAVCCTLDAKYLVRGFKCQDGAGEKLSQDDLIRCLRAKQTLMQESSRAIINAFSPFTSPGCRTAASCHDALQDALRGLAGDLDMIADDHPFFSWVYFARRLEGYAICALCKERLKERVQAEQRLIWNSLPDILGLTIKGWPELSGSPQVDGARL